MGRTDRTIVVHNDFREAPIGELSATCQNVLWTILYAIKDKNIDELKKQGRTDITVPIDTIISLSQYQRGKYEIYKEIEKITEAMTRFRVRFSTDKEEGTLVPFPLITHTKDYSEVHIAVMREFAYIVDYVFTHGNFSKIRLQEINGLKSKYAKIAYYYLSTYKDTGVWSVGYNEFVRIMGIPKDYKPKDIRRRIIDPICKELAPYFSCFQYFEETGKRRRIERLLFVFEPPKRTIRGDVMRQEQLKQLTGGTWCKRIMETERNHEGGFFYKDADYESEFPF